MPGNQPRIASTGLLIVVSHLVFILLCYFMGYDVCWRNLSGFIFPTIIRLDEAELPFQPLKPTIVGSCCLQAFLNSSLPCATIKSSIPLVWAGNCATVTTQPALFKSLPKWMRACWTSGLVRISESKIRQMGRGVQLSTLNLG